MSLLVGQTGDLAKPSSISHHIIIITIELKCLPLRLFLGSMDTSAERVILSLDLTLNGEMVLSSLLCVTPFALLILMKSE